MNDDESALHTGLRIFHFLLLGVHSIVAGVLLSVIPDLEVSVDGAGNARVGVFSGVFLALAALDHGLIIFFWEDVYTKMIESYATRTVWFRWIEYSVSASVMNMQILLLCKCSNISFLMLIALLTIVMNVTGGLAEHKSDRWLRYMVVGWLCFVAIWAIIFTFFGNNGGSSAPSFVIAIVAVLFVLESSFGIVHLAAGMTVDSLNGAYAREYAYAVLSLASKLSLALITYYGTKARSSL